MEKSKFVVCGRGCGSGGVGVWVARSAGVWAWVWVCVRCGWAVWVCGCVGSSVCGGVGMDVGAGVLVLVFFFFFEKRAFFKFFFSAKVQKMQKVRFPNFFRGTVFRFLFAKNEKTHKN